jgi:hypothetical protein
MNEVQMLHEVASIDWMQFAGAILIFMGFFIAVVSLIDKFSNIIGRPIGWFKRNDNDHELLLETKKEMDLLSQKHERDTMESAKHGKEVKATLNAFITEIKQMVGELKNDQKAYAEEQHHISEQLDIITKYNKLRNDALIEEMCDRISQKIRYYVNTLHGIPEDEYDDFVRLMNCYIEIGGNHGLQAKFKKCINTLPILPVETKIQQ